MGAPRPRQQSPTSAADGRHPHVQRLARIAPPADMGPMLAKARELDRKLYASGGLGSGSPLNRTLQSAEVSAAGVALVT